MSNITLFKNPKDREEFLEVFENICGIADIAFNKFEEVIKNDSAHNGENIKRYLSYLIGITKVIRGLRGDYSLLQDDSMRPFFVEKDGIQYDQDSLYKAEGYFCNRLNNAFEILKESDQKAYESFVDLWKY